MKWKRLLLAVLPAALIASVALAARNGSGTYNVPNVFAPGQTISSAKENANFADIGNEITNSLPRDGQAGMTGPLRAIDGTLGQPSLSFNNETATGFRRAAAGDVRLTIGGVDILQMTSSGLTILVSPGLFVATGTIMDFAGDTPPTGYVFTDGSCLSQTTYANLYAVVGNKYGTSCGAGNFNLPDIRGRSTVVPDNLGGTASNRLVNGSCAAVRNTIGGSCGIDATPLTTAQMPLHNHNVYLNDPGHSHTYGPDNLTTAASGTGLSEYWFGASTTSTRYGTPKAFTGMTITSAPGGGQPNATEVAGGNTPVSLMGPSILIPKIIKY